MRFWVISSITREGQLSIKLFYSKNIWVFTIIMKKYWGVFKDIYCSTDIFSCFHVTSSQSLGQEHRRDIIIGHYMPHLCQEEISHHRNRVCVYVSHLFSIYLSYFELILHSAESLVVSALNE